MINDHGCLGGGVEYVGAVCRCAGATGETASSHLLEDREGPFGIVPRVPTVEHVEFASINVCE